MTHASFTAKGDLLYKPQLLRNRGNRLLTGIASLCLDRRDPFDRRDPVCAGQGFSS